MYKFNFKEREYELPTEWSDITVEKYIGLYKLEQTKELYKIDELYAAKMLEVLIGIDEEEMNDMPIEMFISLTNQLTNLTINNLKFNTVNNVTIDGVKYNIQDFNKMSLGQYSSIKILTTDKKYEDVILIVLSCLLIEEGKKFNIDNIELMKDKVKKLSFVEVGDIVNFFLSGKQ